MKLLIKERKFSKNKTTYKVSVADKNKIHYEVVLNEFFSSLGFYKPLTLTKRAIGPQKYEYDAIPYYKKIGFSRNFENEKYKVSIIFNKDHIEFSIACQDEDQYDMELKLQNYFVFD